MSQACCWITICLPAAISQMRGQAAITSIPTGPLAPTWAPGDCGGDYQYALNRTDGRSQSDGRLFRAYLFRPLPALGSKFTLGESDFSVGYFRRIFLHRSLTYQRRAHAPWSLRGYAPQISGIAQTNATVTVSQADRIIYQTKVPPGPFVIRDINQSVQGTLDVTVAEEDGHTSTFQVSAASVPFLTRQGQFAISWRAVNPVRTARIRSKARPLSSEFSGRTVPDLPVRRILNSGNDYRALAAGIGQNMDMLGALSFDVTQASSQHEGEAKQTG